MNADMTVVRDSPTHAFNNLLCKILGAAELALDRASDQVLRAELETIMRLAEAAGAMVEAIGAGAELSTDGAVGPGRTLNAAPARSSEEAWTS